ncbi:serine protease 27-like [Plectropomus leopardus]|uniref:serine protease 27-like n=1 Tax=Plectropomus leopardus TaxID=160734 RepID=UPI001C4CAE90|nr:serine protease 27-like [Plectropomus leopardus]
MTAAHCLTRDDLRTAEVVLGRNSLWGPNLNEVSRRLDKIECHPSYDFLTNENDICLLKLSAPVNFTEYIQPVCLASANSTFHTGVSSWIAGFGATDPDSSTLSDILQEVNVPIVGNNECRCTFPYLTDNMICAGFRAGGRDACQGDSGAPLVTKKGFTWVQSGVVSFGDGCARPLSPGVYTRVSEYQGWISGITGSDEPGFVTYTSSGFDNDLYFDCSTLYATTTRYPTYTPLTNKTTRTTTATTSLPYSFNTTCKDCNDKGGDSVFDSGENIIHFSHFTHFASLCLLLISLFVLIGDV